MTRCAPYYVRGFTDRSIAVCHDDSGSAVDELWNVSTAMATLDNWAKEFISGATLPENFHLLIDPAYAFTNDWKLRWDASRETAYPSTFVIAPDGKIRFAKVSNTHGGRAPADDVLKGLSTIGQEEFK